MFAVFMRLALALWLILCLIVGVLSALPTQDSNAFSDLKAFLLAPDCRGSQTPCWLGIRLGETHRQDAAARLGAHPWVEAVRFIDSANALEVSWNARAPIFLPKNLAAPAYIRFSANDQTAVSIALRVNIPTADFWALAGRPQHLHSQAPVIVATPSRTPAAGSTMPTPTHDDWGYTASHNGYYPWLRLNATISSPCAEEALEFWDGSVVQIHYGSYQQQMPFEGYIDWDAALAMRLCTPIYVST